MVEILLKWDANSDIQQVGRGTALMLASAKGHSEVVEILLKEGLDPNIQLKNGFKCNS